jgi:hypothetical protein
VFEKTKEEGRGQSRPFAIRYLDVKNALIASGYADEIDLQHEMRIGNVTESQFLREAAWVVLCSGMRESVVRAKFAGISTAFAGWASARQIADSEIRCHRDAIKHFAHSAKIQAIIDIAKIVLDVGFATLKSNIIAEGVQYLRRLPFIGPITSYHLAKNIGMNVVKPDRHLVRIAQRAGFDSPEKLCNAIAKEVGDPVCVIDLVLWRYATIEHDCAQLFE